MTYNPAKIDLIAGMVALTHVRKQPIIALYFEFETVLKFYNLKARICIRSLASDVQSEGFDSSCFKVKVNSSKVTCTEFKSVLYLMNPLV